MVICLMSFNACNRVALMKHSDKTNQVTMTDVAKSPPFCHPLALLWRRDYFNHRHRKKHIFLSFVEDFSLGNYYHIYLFLMHIFIIEGFFPHYYYSFYF
ncbi:unnamed protein product [Arctogadus glacialis]